MKLLFLILFFPVVCLSQSKGDSKVLVSVTDTSNLFNRVVKSLYEQGYSIEEKDQQAGFIETKYRELKQFGGKYKMRILFGGGLTITGAYRLESMPEIDLVWKGEKKNPLKESMNSIADFGKLFGVVSYSKWLLLWNVF